MGLMRIGSLWARTLVGTNNRWLVVVDAVPRYPTTVPPAGQGLITICLNTGAERRVDAKQGGRGEVESGPSSTLWR